MNYKNLGQYSRRQIVQKQQPKLLLKISVEKFTYFRLYFELS